MPASSLTKAQLLEFDKAVKLQIDLLRHSVSVEGKVLRLLESMQRDLLSKLSGKSLTDWNRARVNAMLKDAAAAIDATYARVAEEVAQSTFGAATAVANNLSTLRIEQLKVAINKVDARLGLKLVNLDIDAFEQLWKRSSFYVGPNGEGGIAGRYERVRAYIAENASFEASSVYVNPDGVVGFDNGRHRYSAIRDLGNKTIPVAMDAQSIATATKLGLLASGNPATFNVSLRASVPPPAVLHTLATKSLIEGTPSAAWWQRVGKDASFRFSGAVRHGITMSHTNEQIVKAASEALGVTRRNSRALVQTAVAASAGQVRILAIEANKDLYKGYKHLSTLDGHTTPQCIARSNLIWDMDRQPVGHDLPFIAPPVHWNCRSVMLGVLKSPQELGIDLPAFPVGTRSSAEGQISQDTTFEAFLSRRTVEQQDEQLGRGRAQMWREGKITLRDLVDNAGNPLTLSQLRSRYE